MCLLGFSLLGITGQLITVVKEQDVTGEKSIINSIKVYLLYIIECTMWLNCNN